MFPRALALMQRQGATRWVPFWMKNQWRYLVCQQVSIFFKTPSIKMLHTCLGNHLTHKISVSRDLGLIQMVNSRIRFAFSVVSGGAIREGLDLWGWHEGSEMRAKSLGQKGRALTLSCKWHGKERHLCWDAPSVGRVGKLIPAISAEIGDCLSLGLPILLHLLAKARLSQDLKEELVGFPWSQSTLWLHCSWNLNIHPDVQQWSYVTIKT